MMTRTQIVILGLGGQGILFLTRLIAEAAMDECEDVITAETHGMAQRGGAVESHLKIGGFESPLVRLGQADAVITVDPSRQDPARSFLKPSGYCVMNSPESCDATRLAKELNAPRAANLILLGRACAQAPTHFPGQDTILKTLERLSPSAALESNRRAFQRGSER